MIYQRFYRGICDYEDPNKPLDCAWLMEIFEQSGLQSAWVRNGRPGKLTIDMHTLQRHVTDIANLPHSPFVSLSAGTRIWADDGLGTKPVFPAWFTAVCFATGYGHHPGWVFCGYVGVAGKPALGMVDYCEEVRDLNQFGWMNPHHTEGELAAKVSVRPSQIEGAYRVEVEALLAIFGGATWPELSPGIEDQLGQFGFHKNPYHCDPRQHNSVRDWM